MKSSKRADSLPLYNSALIPPLLSRKQEIFDKNLQQNGDYTINSFFLVRNH